MSQLPPKKTEWVLTQEGFDRLLAWLDPDPARAGGIYEVIRRRMVLYFTLENCSPPEDLADETINRVVRKLEEEGEIKGYTPDAFFKGVARLLRLEYYRKPETKGQSLESLSPEQNLSVHLKRSEDPRSKDVEDEILRREELREQCYDRCLGELPFQARRTLLTYYTGEKGEKIKQRKSLAIDLKITPKALTGRVLRYEKKLLECVEDCLKDLVMA